MLNMSTSLENGQTMLRQRFPVQINLMFFPELHGALVTIVKAEAVFAGSQSLEIISEPTQQWLPLMLVIDLTHLEELDTPEIGMQVI